eukprot:gene1003-9655_t
MHLDAVRVLTTLDIEPTPSICNIPFNPFGNFGKHLGNHLGKYLGKHLGKHNRPNIGNLGNIGKNFDGNVSPPPPPHP